MQQQEQLKALRDKQAAIRDRQRERMDIIHATCHEYLRNVERKNLGREVEDKIQDDMIRKIHEISHLFMWDFDNAVLIHERMAEIEGRDPKEVTRSLLPVRTVIYDDLAKVDKD